METLRGELEWAHQKLAAAEQETRDARAQVAAADDELTALQAAKAAVDARHKTLRDQVWLLVWGGGCWWGGQGKAGLKP